MKKRVIRILLCFSIIASVTWAMTTQVEIIPVQMTNELTAVDIDEFIEQRNPKLDPMVREHIAKCIVKTAKKNHLKTNLVVAWVDTENESWNPLAKSHKGAVGLTQVIPFYYKTKMEELGITKNTVYHIDKNLELGCSILRDNLDEFGDLKLALSGYNAGPTITRKVGIPKYKETREYIQKVLAMYGELDINSRSL